MVNVLIDLFSKHPREERKKERMPTMAGMHAHARERGEGIRAQDEQSHDVKDACGWQHDGFAVSAASSEESNGDGLGDGLASKRARCGGCIGGGARGEGVGGFQDGKCEGIGGGRLGDGCCLVQREGYCESGSKAGGAPQDEGCNESESESENWGMRSGCVCSCCFALGLVFWLI